MSIFCSHNTGRSRLFHQGPACGLATRWRWLTSSLAIKARQFTQSSQSEPACAGQNPAPENKGILRFSEQENSACSLQVNVSVSKPFPKPRFYASAPNYLNSCQLWVHVASCRHPMTQYIPLQINAFKYWDSIYLHSTIHCLTSHFSVFL